MNSNNTNMNSKLLPRIALIACGSFSPPTPMHLRMFEIARDFFNTSGTHKVVGGIMSPVHDGYGKKDLAPVKHRLEMVKIATRTSSWIRLSDWESRQSEHSRTILVLQFHQNYMNNFINSEDCENNEECWLPEGLRERKDCIQLRLLCGGDLLESFATPGLWTDEDIEDIVGNHGLVVITRSGSNPQRFIFESDMLTKYQKNITLIPNWVPNEVSSTMVRRHLRRNLSVKYLIDDHIIEYVKKHGLYGSKPEYLTSLFENDNANANDNDTDAGIESNVYNLTYLDQLNTLLVSASHARRPSGNANHTGLVDSGGSDMHAADEYMDDTELSLSDQNLLNSYDDRNNENGNGNDDGGRSGSGGGLCRSVSAGGGGVFCCKKSPTKLLLTRPRPGQAVQVITREDGVTQRIVDEAEIQAKRMKVSAVQDI